MNANTYSFPVGSSLVVNGRKFTVKRCAPALCELTGRGGGLSLLALENSGRSFIVGTDNREKLVTELRAA